MDDLLVELDERRRVSLGRVGRKEHTRYLVHEAEDGTLTFRPVKIVPLSELKDPQVHAAVEKSLANLSTTGLVSSLDDL